MKSAFTRAFFTKQDFVYGMPKIVPKYKDATFSTIYGKVRPQLVNETLFDHHVPAPIHWNTASFKKTVLSDRLRFIVDSASDWNLYKNV